jgi:hypothetical protein
MKPGIPILKEQSVSDNLVTAVKAQVESRIPKLGIIETGKRWGEGVELMPEKLKILIEKARQTRMTPQEIEEQRVSFAYGNGNYEDRRVTRAEVIRASRSLSGGHETPEGSSW